MNLRFLICFLLLAISPLAFADSEQGCAECHQSEVKKWQGSHHALAMQVANEKTVLGNFNHAEFKHLGVMTKFYKRDGNYYIYTEGDAGHSEEYRVKYTFGVDPLQQYLVEFPRGRLQAFSVAWDTRKKQWFHLYGHEKISAHDPLFWTKRFYNWNRYCADCHSTQLRENYDSKTDSFNTSFAAVNVSCQACHGPTEKHIAWAKAHSNSANKGFEFSYKNWTSTQAVEACAFCHSRRHAITKAVKTGTPFFDNYVPEVLRDNLYQVDGGIKAEVFEYGSFTQSKMSKAGVRCTDCHEAHSATLKLTGNNTCVQCHNQKPPLSRFPNLVSKNYNSTAHTHHALDSSGAQCVNCHMPTKTYMQVHLRHDHYFRVPKPALTIKYGIPNTCNNCHKDKSAEWAEKMMMAWRGGKASEPDYTDTLASARAGLPSAEANLIQLVNDQHQASIVRASAAYLLQNYNSPASTDTLIALTQDADPWVRQMSIAPFAEAPADLKIRSIGPLLTDPLSAVRQEAASSFANVPPALLTPSQQTAFNQALTEYKETQLALSDTPEANLNLGVLAETMRENQSAETYYQRAIRQDPSFFPASQNLAIYYNNQHRNKEAIAVLKQAITLSPEQGQLLFSLGLLLSEEKDYIGSAECLRRATKLLPTNAGVYYNYGLALEHMNKGNEAKAALLTANKLEPQDMKILYALSLLCLKRGEKTEAKIYYQLLLQQYPEAPKIPELD